MIKNIVAVSVKKLEEGSIGFLCDDSDKWYNINGEVDHLQQLLQTTIKKGNTIEFDFDNFTNKVSNIRYVNFSEPTKKEFKKPTKDEMNNLDDLLDSAHKKGLISIETELIHADYEKKTAVFKAVVKGWVIDGDKKFIGTFTAHGDATVDNVQNEIAKSWIRMAETRAIVRALRWYTNNAACSEEELPEEIENVDVKKELLKIMQSEDQKHFEIAKLPALLKTSVDEVNKVVLELLNDGTIYEPTAGFIAYLG